MTHRQILESLWLRRALLLAVLGAFAAPGFAGQAVAPPRPAVLVINSGYRLVIDSEKGSIVSLRSTFGVDHELLIPGHADLPLFKVEFMDDHGEFKTVTSSEAKTVSVKKSRDAEGETITIDYAGIGELPVDAHVTIRCPSRQTLTYWTLELNNRTSMWIGHIQFPVVEVPFDRLDGKDYSHILWSALDGALAGPVEPSMSAGTPWGQFSYDAPEVWRYNNYPGEGASTQLMAYYNDAGGLYVACDDPKGLPKFINPLLERDGVTMGVGHFPGTRGPGATTIPYNVVIGTFHGDWYAAAEIYRDWASKQPFCATKLAQRTDVPKWLADSPPVIAFPMRGQGDWDPPAAENPEYTPLTNALPYLDKLAAALDGPVMPIIFNWEHGGPWVQPEAYPPVGGEAAFREFMTKAKARGWHPMIYGDGLCWVISQKNTNYDGMPYFREHDGEVAVARKWDGSIMEDVWPWRKDYVTCVGTEKGRQMILNMTHRMAALGPDVVQQFDQGPGPRACYAPNHGHPPVPGPWMSEAFDGLIKADLATARSVNPTVAMSCEGAPPETHLQNFQIWDGRVTMCPLYSFLYHEYESGIQGFYTNRVSDEALRVSVARALVTGYIFNFTLRDKGLVEYDWDQTWTRAVPDQAAFLDWAKRVSRFRAGVARNYLVYGRMLRPWKVSGVTQRDFGWGNEPLVKSSTWRAPDGRVGVVLVNTSNLPETPRVELEGEGNKSLVLYTGEQKTAQKIDLPHVLDVPMEPRSLYLIELQ
jgi:hypothetical protein